MKPIKILFLASILFSLHAALLAYVHSSMLGSYITKGTVGLCFSISSILSLLLLFAAPTLEKIFGSYKILLCALCISLLFLSGLALTKNALSVVFFVVYFSLNTTIWYNFNLSIEHFAVTRTMGSLRGMYLTLSNLAWVGAPILSGYIIMHGGIQKPYLFAMVPVLLSLLLLLRYKKMLNSRERAHKSHNLLSAIQVLHKNKTLKKILYLTWSLQLFYAIMALFMAPYLQGFGISWEHIGIIFSIMLLPFVLFEFPVGKYLDTAKNERGVLSIGFALMAFTIPLLLVPLSISMWYFASILFISRVGAAMVEVATDSFFFRQIDESDTGLASLYQSTLPLAYLVGPLLGGVLFACGGFHLLFTVFCAGLLLSALYAYYIK